MGGVGTQSFGRNYASLPGGLARKEQFEKVVPAMARHEANRLKKNSAAVKAADCIAVQTDNPPGSLLKITRPPP